MNAADEVALGAFLEGRLSFTGIYRVVTDTFRRLTDRASLTSLDAIISSDREARRIANELI
jgi:1-deoxy-D-xylulose-5-phosphate reductoisomerase